MKEDKEIKQEINRVAWMKHTQKKVKIK